MTIAAKIIADSISPQGIRLTTMQITMHRFVLAEFNTHRMFSRNFRSSRAVPVKKLLEETENNPATPIFWGKNQPGMQAREELTGADLFEAQIEWRAACRDAIKHAKRMVRADAHKQIINRVLEPYLYVHGVVTATNYANFYALRRHADAQPEIKALADAMWDAQQASTPKLLNSGEWHLPYVTEDDERRVSILCHKVRDYDYYLTRLSVARCARVSYLTNEGKEPSIEADLALYDRLVGSTPLHASPAEHQATPDERIGMKWARYWVHGNLTGWRQFRKTLPGEFVPG